MSTTKLSIGIPVYNQVKTIRDTIESALNQITPAYEIVVCENHSTDGTADIVNEYKDRVKIVNPPVHLKMAANWNYCVNSCKGDWVGLISGDDILYPNYTGAMITGINKRKDAIFVMGGWNVHNKIIDRIEPRYLLSMKQITITPKTTKMLLSGPKASFSSFCFKKETFTKIGGYNENFHLCQDWIFQFEMSLTGGSFIKSNEIISKYIIEDRYTLNRNRIILHIEDQRNYLSSKIWEARNVGIKTAEIVKSGGKVFLNLLSYISSNNFEGKDNISLNLKEIAVKFNMLNIYNVWLINGELPQKNHTKYLVLKFLRKLYNNYKKI